MKKLFTIVALFFCLAVIAQQGSIFEHITTQNGLPSNYIFCITEDENGFIWAGSDKGLLMYDGAKWVVYDVDNGLPGNYVNNIIPDKHGGLWLGISGTNAVWFNINTKTVFQITFPNDKPKTLLLGMDINEKGNLNLPFYETDGSYTLFTCFINNPTKAVKIGYIKNDRNSNELESSFLINNKKIIYAINKTFGNKPSIDTDSTHYVFVQLNNRDSYTFFGDKDFMNGVGNFLAGYNFVIKVNGDSYKIITQQKLFERDKKQNFLIQVGNLLYFSKLGEGFCTIDTLGNVAKFNTSNGLSNNDVNHMYAAKNGTIYLSTLGGGINIIKSQHQLQFQLPKLPSTNVQLYNGKYYVQAKNTISVINENKIERVLNFSHEILSFFVQNNKIFIGSFNGLEQYSLTSNNLSIEKLMPITAGISSILPHKNKLIVSTYGSGFVVFENGIEQKRIKNFPFDNIEKLYPISTGYAAASYENGFFTLNNELKVVKYFTQKSGLLSNAVYHVHEFKDTLWVAGKNGITCLSKNKVIKTYSISNGFKNKKANYIFTDSVGNHFIVANVLYKLINDSLQIVNQITTQPNNNILCVNYNALKNELAIGATANFSLLNLNKHLGFNKPEKPRVYKTTINGNADSLKSSYTLPYKYGSITFFFANSTAGLFKSDDLFYKVEGYTNDWLKVDDSLAINILQLPPGKYKLLAKFVDISGTQSAEILITNIVVQQPIWLRNWMLLLYAIGGFLMMYFGLQYYNKRKYQKKYEVLKLQQQLENERQRISRDLHDNMGAYTSALLNNVAQAKHKMGQTDEFDKMKTNADNILSSLRETIWVLNNKEISLLEFSDSFKDYCFKLLRNYETISFNATENIQNNYELPAKTSIHVNKILQEAVQNIIKHANATVINYSISSAPNLQISISDNGTGYNLNEPNEGNGLHNMQWRAKEINCTINMQSSANGTSIIIDFLMVKNKFY